MIDAEMAHSPSATRSREKSAQSNQYSVCWEFDPALANLITDPEMRKDRDEKLLLDKTVIVAMDEFGRVPGELTAGARRDPHRYAAAPVWRSRSRAREGYRRYRPDGREAVRYGLAIQTVHLSRRCHVHNLLGPGNQLDHQID